MPLLNRATGEEFRGHFQSLAGLRADDRVLDIGCGIGRMARILVPVLRPPGSYDGFDVVREGIDWCRGHYVATPAPFGFHHADLHNALYNPQGREAPETYRFPFADASFDLAVRARGTAVRLRGALAARAPGCPRARSQVVPVSGSSPASVGPGTPGRARLSRSAPSSSASSGRSRHHAASA